MEKRRRPDLCWGGADLELGGSIGYRASSLDRRRHGQDLIKGRYDLSQGLALTATTEIKRETHNTLALKVALLTRIFERPGMQTEIKGVYEATDDGMISEGAMVYGAKSEWSVNERHTLTASRTTSAGATERGTRHRIALDWSYKANQNETRSVLSVTAKEKKRSNPSRGKRKQPWDRTCCCAATDCGPLTLPDGHAIAST